MMFQKLKSSKCHKTTLTLEGRDVLVWRSAVAGNRWAPLGVASWKFLWLQQGGSVKQSNLGEWVNLIRGEKLMGGGSASNSWMFSFLFTSWQFSAEATCDQNSNRR